MLFFIIFTSYQYFVTTMRLSNESVENFFRFVKSCQAVPATDKKAQLSFCNMLSFFWQHAMLAFVSCDTPSPFSRVSNSVSGYFLRKIVLTKSPPEVVAHYLLGLMSETPIPVINQNSLVVQFKNRLWLFYLQFTTTYVLPKIFWAVYWNWLRIVILFWAK